MHKILICEDEYDTGKILSEILQNQNYEVILVEDGLAGLKEFEKHKPDIVLLDIFMPKLDGLSLLQKIMEQDEEQIVIMLTGSANIKQSVQAMKLGAYDYLTKPFDVEEMLLIIKNALKTHSLHKEVKELKKQLAKRETSVVIGESRSIQNVIRLIDLVSPTGMSVLITGESGTGKEVFAREIHKKSTRQIGAFVALDCGAIPENLLESELFGYEKGAFTGADHSRQGKFEDAHGGTLLLDEITNLSFDGQAKLLRALEEKKIRHVGGQNDIEVDVRIIATTNLELQEVLQDGKFRLDLFHRLNEFQIQLPALRERREDIPGLANYFLKQANQELCKDIHSFSSQAMDYLINNEWMGNVRELKHSIKRAVLVCEGSEITIDDLNFGRSNQSHSVDISNLDELGKNFHEIVFAVEKKLIISALKKTAGNKTKAAKILGLNRKALYRKLDSLNIQEDL